MATKKPNLSDLLRQEAKQEPAETTAAKASKPKASIPESPKAPAPKPLEKMTKAQLLEHIKALEAKSPATSKPAPVKDEQAEAKNLVLTGQVKALEEKLATQQKAIADAEKTIKTLKSDSSAKTKLEKELDKQKKLVKKLSGEVKTLESQQKEQEAQEAERERTIEEDRALVLARISSYQVNLKFPSQPNPSIPEDQIGWFD